MSKHTPGPWMFNRTNDFKGATYFEVTAIDGERILYEGYNRKRDSSCIPQAEADARLIAAAPELLEFAKHVLEQINSGACGYIDGSESQLKGYAEQLINKAEGKE